MDIIEISLLAVALGIDCFIVSFSQGLIFKKQRLKNSLNLAFVMGLFQGLMPIIGYVAINKVQNLLLPYSKHLVFGIFFILGLHFLIEAFRNDEEDKFECIGWQCLLSMGLATSIDALISGVSIKLTYTSLTLSCALIGIVSFLMSQCGFWLGNTVKHIPKRYLQTAGGLILILLAIKSVF